MNKKFFAFTISFLFFINLGAVKIDPKNIFLDHYELIPPLGKVKSIATSINKLFAISNNYLLIFDKNDLQLIRTTYFNQEIFMLAYDQFYDELWIPSINTIIRYNINLGSIREYQFAEKIKGVGITPEKIYISSQGKYALDRTSGKLEQIAQFPQNIRWFKGFEEKELKNYKFLSPYYYQDALNETNDPFYQYEITTFYDDGMYLYVGTDRYGILKYNKVSLEKERVIYGPLTTSGQKLKKIGNDYYFISSVGFSRYKSGEQKSWQYFRLKDSPGDLIYFNDQLIVSYGNQLTKITGAVSMPLVQFRNTVLTLNFDEFSIYVGTDDGMYRILRESNEPLDFGPDRYPVYIIFPTKNQLFVGGEFATYRFDRSTNKWFPLLSRGAKDICEANHIIYFLTTDNQLIQYAPLHDYTLSENDTLPIVLPYFNIYDIDSDGKILYCATASGINYFDPERQLYNPVYNLPRIKYNYVAVIDEDIIAVSDQNIYRLPIRFRD